MLLYTNSFLVFINSTILSNNHHYLSHLHLFLVPEVGYSSQWSLCYRQSSHGDLDTTFHEKCDGKEKTVTIVQEKEFVFGGYTDIPWGICNCLIYKYVSIVDTSYLLLIFLFGRFLFLFVSLPFLPVLLSEFMPVCLSVCLSVRLSVYLSVCPSVRPSVCPSVRLSVCLPDCLFICLPACLFVCLSVCLSPSLSVCRYRTQPKYSSSFICSLTIKGCTWEAY